MDGGARSKGPASQSPHHESPQTPHSNASRQPFQQNTSSNYSEMPNVNNTNKLSYTSDSINTSKIDTNSSPGSGSIMWSGGSGNNSSNNNSPGGGYLNNPSSSVPLMRYNANNTVFTSPSIISSNNMLSNSNSPNNNYSLPNFSMLGECSYFLHFSVIFCMFGLLL